MRPTSPTKRFRVLNFFSFPVPQNDVTISLLVFQSKSQHTEEMTFPRPHRASAVRPLCVLSRRRTTRLSQASGGAAGGGDVCQKMKG